MSHHDSSKKDSSCSVGERGEDVEEGHDPASPAKRRTAVLPDDSNDDDSADGTATNDASDAPGYGNSVRRLMAAIACAPSFGNSDRLKTFMVEVRSIVMMHEAVAEELLIYLESEHGRVVRSPPVSTLTTVEPLADASPKHRNLFISSMLASDCRRY